MTKPYTTVLTIAGSDGSGGAGIQADLKTFAALGCYGLSVITAVTSQNTMGVKEVFTLDNKSILSQCRTIAEDIRIDAVKIGMIGNGENIVAIAAFLKELAGKPPVILDTVLGSSGGQTLLQKNAVKLMVKELFPLATVVTPNLPETIVLTGMKKTPETRESIEKAAVALLETGAASVLVKGGHGAGNECSDCLALNGSFFWFSSNRVKTENTHGTGCTLSSAIAAFMAKGFPLHSAVEQAKAYLTEALAAGAAWRLGHGNGPLHHCYRYW
ncbi:MAG: bifunctional hydroxymethylpyrimidine kinase/phosphomethylpyrimidine kinase [Chlorobium sp.]|nr:MAG: bifunctional hydroxymethylpyrimidine kinase/phosphomethylpyrimidine kinase [Chlorobium sp.]